ncbi:MAG: hypothetical protein AB7F43_00355 [Bacteriovoracia bacterium]
MRIWGLFGFLGIFLSLSSFSAPLIQLEIKVERKESCTVLLRPTTSKDVPFAHLPLQWSVNSPLVKLYETEGTPVPQQNLSIEITFSKTEQAQELSFAEQEKLDLVLERLNILARKLSHSGKNLDQSLPNRYVIGTRIVGSELFVILTLILQKKNEDLSGNQNRVLYTYTAVECRIRHDEADEDFQPNIYLRSIGEDCEAPSEEHALAINLIEDALTNWSQMFHIFAGKNSQMIKKLVTIDKLTVLSLETTANHEFLVTKKEQNIEATLTPHKYSLVATIDLEFKDEDEDSFSENEPEWMPKEWTPDSDRSDAH